MTQLRKSKGLKTGGQWATQPGGPLAAGKQAQLLGPHPESIARDQAKADFKRHKKEAMDRFLAKQKIEREEQHALGLPGKQTIKLIEKRLAAGIPRGRPLDKKLKRLEIVAHRQMLQGWFTKRARAGRNTGDITPGGVHKLAKVTGRPGNLKAVTMKVIKAGDITTGGKHWFTNRFGLLVKATIPPPKGPATLWQESINRRAEQHQRHVDLRVAKKAELFREGKNIAAKRFNMKKKGLSFQTPVNKVGDVSKGGKFLALQARGVHRNRLWKDGEPKITWRLIPTKDRAGGVQPLGRVRPASAFVQSYPKRWKPPTGGTVFTADDGSKMTVLPKQPSIGIFQKVIVSNEDGSKGVLKSDGILENRGRGPNAGEFAGIVQGFARREVLASEVDQMIGLGIVPPTKEVIISKNGLDDRMGSYHSLQTWIDDTELGENYVASDVYKELEDKEEVGKMLLVDTLLGNGDRHGQNWLVGGKPGARHIYAIDNGLSMTSTETNAVSMARDWVSELTTPVQRFEGGKAILNPKYRTEIQRVLADGSLKKLVYGVHNSSKYNGGRRAQAAEALLVRAQSVVDRWDDIFKNL